MRLLPLLAIIFVAASVPAQRIHVDAAAKPGGDGKSWATAFDTLQKGLAAASRGASVWVAGGSYKGGFVIPAGVSVLGGFQSGDTRETQRNGRTFLDGEAKQRVVALGEGSVLDGCWVRGGNAGGLGGGGALIDRVRATIRFCAFQDNRNTAGRAAALHVANGGHVTLQNTIFYRNQGFGHVIDFTGSSGVVDHVVVHDNTSNGLHFHAGSSPKIYNSIFTNNTGRGICHISATDDPVVWNNLIWNNGVSLFHYRGRELRTIAEVNNLAYAARNVTGDPRFLQPARWEFELLPGSPAIDKGYNTPPAPWLPRCWLGNSRLLDGDLNGSMIADIGAVEHASGTLFVLGELRPGRTIQVRFGGKSSLAGLLLLGVEPAVYLVDPFGYLRVDVTKPVVPIPWPLNSPVDLTVPASLKPGTTLTWQGLLAGPSGGNLTNLVDLLAR